MSILSCTRDNLHQGTSFRRSFTLQWRLISWRGCSHETHIDVHVHMHARSGKSYSLPHLKASYVLWTMLPDLLITTIEIQRLVILPPQPPSFKWLRIESMSAQKAWCCKSNATTSVLPSASAIFNGVHVPLPPSVLALFGSLLCASSILTQSV